MAKYTAFLFMVKRRRRTRPASGKSIDHCQSTSLRQYNTINTMRTKQKGGFLLVNDVISTLDSKTTLKKKENKTIKRAKVPIKHAIPSTFTCSAYCSVLLLLHNVICTLD